MDGKMDLSQVEALWKLTHADVDQLIRVWVAGFPNTDPEQIREFVPEVVIDDSAEIVVARNPLGYIASALVVGTLPGRDKRRAYVDDVATHPDHLRQGYGGAALDFAIDWSRAVGATRIYLNSNDERVAAHGLYKSRGFYIHETSSFQKDL